jgi:fumarylacetoacetase
MSIDVTHDPALRSWVDSANAEDCEFPIQNLPFGRFRRAHDTLWSIGVAIGSQVLDLRRAGLIGSADMKRLMRSSPTARQTLRKAISSGLREGSAMRRRFEPALAPLTDVELGMPCDVRDYTDFYVGIHHATAVGKLFRPDNPLLPNYKHVPIGYHGRASTLNVSGQNFHRPMGQLMVPGAAKPELKPSERVDYELEVGIFIGRPNEQGVPITVHHAEEHVFGVALFNDWSARDIQSWEYQPLGPFLSKSFASTVSPWIVTTEALAPFRRAFTRPTGDPEPLPYLDSQANRKEGAVDIELGVWLQTETMRAAGYGGDCIASSNFADAAYWTMAQLVTHHTVNGCSLSTGDLFGSGTLSGAGPGQAGSLLELTKGGKQPIRLSNGEERTFLRDGDSIILRGYCEREGFRRIGFGECAAMVMPARN